MLEPSNEVSIVRTLILNSSVPTRRMLKLYLEKDPEHHYSVTEETQASAASRAYSQQGFDLVLLGEQCDGGGPIAFLDSLLKSQEYWHPVIFVHSGSDHERSIEALHHGSQVSLAIGELTSFELQLNIQKVLGTLSLYRRNRAMTEELARSNQELSQFAYAVAHDLREPLRKVQSFGDLLAESLGPNLDGDSAHYLDRIVDGARRASEMMRALLDYAKISRQGITGEWIDWNEVLHEVQNDLDLVIQEKKARIQIHQPLPMVLGERVRFHQLLQNLIGNALKYSLPNVEPHIQIFCKNLGEEKWEIQIQDNGIGFSPDQSERIFGLFQRLHGRSSGYEGHGVGLALCKRIVETMGGRLEAVGIVSKGATFKILLPHCRSKESL